MQCIIYAIFFLCQKKDKVRINIHIDNNDNIRSIREDWG